MERGYFYGAVEEAEKIISDDRYFDLIAPDRSLEVISYHIQRHVVPNLSRYEFEAEKLESYSFLADYVNTALDAHDERGERSRAVRIKLNANQLEDIMSLPIDENLELRYRFEVRDSMSDIQKAYETELAKNQQKDGKIKKLFNKMRRKK